MLITLKPMTLSRRRAGRTPHTTCAAPACPHSVLVLLRFVVEISHVILIWPTVMGMILVWVLSPFLHVGTHAALDVEDLEVDAPLPPMCVSSCP